MYEAKNIIDMHIFNCFSFSFLFFYCKEMHLLTIWVFITKYIKMISNLHFSHQSFANKMESDHESWYPLIFITLGKPYLKEWPESHRL